MKQNKFGFYLPKTHFLLRQFTKVKIAYKMLTIVILKNGTRLYTSARTWISS